MQKNSDEYPKSRPAIEKAARERKLEGGRKGGSVSPTKLPQNFGEASENEKDKKNETDSKLAEIAGVNRETYRQGKRVLDSGNQEIIDRMAKGELSVNAAYKAIVEGEQAEYHGNRYEKSGLPQNFVEVQKLRSG